MGYQIYTPGGTYAYRRDYLASVGCKVHIQFHANAGGGSYTLTEVNERANNTTRTLARKLADGAAAIFGVKSNGVNELSPGERGHVCIGEELDGIILELWFTDNKAEATRMRSAGGQDQLAHLIADKIRETYPDGTKIGLTLGHVGNRVGDEGATLYPDGTPNDGDDTEAEIMGKVLQRVITLLKEPNVPVPAERLFFEHVTFCRTIAEADFVVEWCKRNLIKGAYKLPANGRVVVWHADQVKSAKLERIFRGRGFGGYAFQTTQAGWDKLRSLGSSVPESPFQMALIPAAARGADLVKYDNSIWVATPALGTTGWYFAHCSAAKAAKIDAWCDGHGIHDAYTFPATKDSYKKVYVF